jgi:hypothetical protein
MEDHIFRMLRQLGTAGGPENAAEMICSMVSSLLKSEREGFQRESESFQREFQREREGIQREREGFQKKHEESCEGFQREREALQREREALREGSRDVSEGFKRERECLQRELAFSKQTAVRAAEAAEELSRRELEALQAIVDRELGLMGTRSIIERIAMEVGPKKSTTAAISDLFTQKDTKFYAYLCQVAASRSVKVYDLVEAGKSIYSELSSRMHHGIADLDYYEATSLPLPTTTVLAIGAVFKFNRRNPSFVRQKLPSPAVTPATQSASSSASGSPE